MSPLPFFSNQQWTSLCKKYKLSPKIKSKAIGSGISANVYSFGSKLVIKETTCPRTLAAARMFTKTHSSVIAKVYEVGKCKVHNYLSSHYIIQERIPKRVNQKVIKFCDHFQNFAETLDYVGNKKSIKSILDIAIELNRCGIDLSQISDLHYDNIFAAPNGDIKIIDLGCLGVK